MAIVEHAFLVPAKDFFMLKIIIELKEEHF